MLMHANNCHAPARLLLYNQYTILSPDLLFNILVHKNILF